MSGHDTRRASSHIGGLTSKDHYREKALKRKIDETYRSMSSTSSARLRRRQLRIARGHERALEAQRKRPQSALTAFAVVLVGLFAVVVVVGAPSTLMLIVAALLLIDLAVVRRRRRILRRL
jgi:Flp pilus assembly protein TadB